MELYPQLILDALATVRYPGTGKNIVEMKMVDDDMRIAGLSVSFTLIFDKPTACKPPDPTCPTSCQVSGTSSPSPAAREA